MLGNFFVLLLLSAVFFKINFFKIFLQEHHLSEFEKGLDPNSVGPDLDPNYLQSKCKQQTTNVAFSKEKVSYYLGLIGRKPDFVEANKGTDQPAHWRKLISTLLICYVENVKAKLDTC